MSCYTRTQLTECSFNMDPRQRHDPIYIDSPNWAGAILNRRESRKRALSFRVHFLVVFARGGLKLDHGRCSGTHPLSTHTAQTLPSPCKTIRRARKARGHKIKPPSSMPCACLTRAPARTDGSVLASHQTCVAPNSGERKATSGLSPSIHT